MPTIEELIDEALFLKDRKPVPKNLNNNDDEACNHLGSYSQNLCTNCGLCFNDHIDYGLDFKGEVIMKQMNNETGYHYEITQNGSLYHTVPKGSGYKAFMLKKAQNYSYVRSRGNEQISFFSSILQHLRSNFNLSVLSFNLLKQLAKNFFGNFNGLYKGANAKGIMLALTMELLKKHEKCLNITVKDLLKIFGVAKKHYEKGLKIATGMLKREEIVI